MDEVSVTLFASAPDLVIGDVLAPSTVDRWIPARRGKDDEVRCASGGGPEQAAPLQAGTWVEASPAARARRGLDDAPRSKIAASGKGEGEGARHQAGGTGHEGFRQEARGRFRSDRRRREMHVPGRPMGARAS